MKKYSKLFKRAQAWVLTIAMLLPILSSGFMLGVFAADETPEPTTKDETSFYEGQIVAENYLLTAQEVDLLKSGLLIGKTYKIVVPTDKDELVSIDKDTWETTAKELRDDDGFVWVPTRAQYIIGVGDTDPVVSFQPAGNGEYVASTEKVADVDAFSVKVEYVLSAEVDAATQQTLLAATANLANALDTYDAIFTANTNLNTVTLAMEVLGQLADGMTYDLGILGVQTLKLGEEAIAAVEALEAQMEANNGVFELTALIEAYKAADLKVRYMMENNLYDELAETHGYIETILADNALTNTTIDQILAAQQPQNAEYWSAMKQIIANTADELEACMAEDGWALFETQILKDEMSDEDWAKLNAFFFDANNKDGKRKTVNVSETIPTAKNPLTFGTTMVQCNMDMFNLTVNVVLELYNEKEGKPTASQTGTATSVLADGANLDAIVEAVLESGAEAAAIAAWGDDFVEAHFDRVVQVPTADADGKYAEDVTYTITYTPKTYNVEWTETPEANATGFYGQKVTLPKHPSTEQSYDYTVTMNGVTVKYYEGTEVIITGDMVIGRKTGKAYTAFTQGQLVAQTYFDGNGRVMGILTSDALLVGKDVLKIRVPELAEADELVTLVREDGKHILTVAPTYASAYEDLNWVAEIVVLDEDGNVVADTNSLVFNEQNQADLSDLDYTRVKVTYKLVLPMDVADLVGLPAELVDEAKNQMSVLDRLAAQKDTLAQLDKTKLGGMKGMIGTMDGISDDVKNKLMADIDGLIAECFDGSAFKLNNLIDGYANGGLTYYYRNYEKFDHELDVLCRYLDSMLEDEKRDALVLLLESQNMGEFADKLDGLQGSMNGILADLSAPNAAIDVQSDALDNLVPLLKSDSIVTPVARPEVVVVSDTFERVSPNRVQPVASIVVGDKNVPMTLPSFGEADVLTAVDVEAIKAVVKKAYDASISGNEFFFDTLSDDAINSELAKLDELVGSEAAKLEDVALALECNYREFALVIPSYNNDSVSKTFTWKDLNNGEFYSFTLDASGVDATHRCDFTIPGRGTKISLTSTNSKVTVTLSTEEIKALYASPDVDVRVITMEVVDLTEEKLEKFVENLNSSSNSAVSFILTKDAEGNYSIIMKMEGAASAETATAMAGMAMAFATSGYSYIAMADQPVMYMTETNDLAVSVQAVYDALMHSGFSTDDLADAFNANGVVNHEDISGRDVLVGDANAKAGGNLIATTLSLGNNAQDATSVSFHINVDNVSSELLQVRNLLVDELNNVIKVEFKDGTTALTLALPDKAYEAFVASLLITGTIDLNEINDIDAEIGVQFFKHFIDPVFTGEASLDAVANTLNMFGFTASDGRAIDLSGYESAFNAIRGQYNGTKIEYPSKDTISITKNPGIGSALDAMGVPSELSGMITGDTVKITLSASVTNLLNVYEAIYVDVMASNFVDKIGMTTNVADRLNKVDGVAIVVLLKDINGTLNVPGTTVLNLNGFTVNGNVNGKGNLTIVDSSMNVSEDLSVTGDVTGNATILGGRYKQGLNQRFFKSGYEQDADGYVGNMFFDFVKDEEGNLTIELDAGGILTNRKTPDLTAMIMDLAVDMLFNGYSTNKICIDDNLVYQLQVPDFVNLYVNRTDAVVSTLLDMVDKDAIFNIVNTLMADLTDYEALYEAVSNRAPIATYKLTTASWDLLPAYIPEGKDYFTMGIVSGNEINRELRIQIVGTDDELNAVSSVLEVMAEVVDVDASIGLDLGRDGNNLLVHGQLTNHVVLDFAKNPKYTIMFAVILADGLRGQEISGEIVEGIEIFYQTSNIFELNKAFDKVTLGQAITALEAISRGDTMGAMIDNLGLSDVVGDDVREIGGRVVHYAWVLARAVTKLEAELPRVEDFLDNTGITFGRFYAESESGYGLPHKEGTLDYTRELFKGYEVTLKGTVDLKYIVKMFRYVPTIDGDAIDLSQYSNIAYLEIDNVGMKISMDADCNGVTVADFVRMLLPAFRTSDGGLTGLIVVGGDGTEYRFDKNGNVIPSLARSARSAEEALVGTGFTVAACTEGTPDGHDAYTVVILGDIDGDGRTTSADPQRIAVLLTYGNDIPYTVYQEAAMDINRDGKVDISDAQAMAVKYVYWEAYRDTIKAKA